MAVIYSLDLILLMTVFWFLISWHANSVIIHFYGRCQSDPKVFQSKFCNMAYFPQDQLCKFGSWILFGSKCIQNIQDGICGPWPSYTGQRSVCYRHNNSIGAGRVRQRTFFPKMLGGTFQTYLPSQRVPPGCLSSLECRHLHCPPPRPDQAS